MAQHLSGLGRRAASMRAESTSSFLDGHVQFVKDQVATAVWRAIGTMNGHEVVSQDSF